MNNLPESYNLNRYGATIYISDYPCGTHANIPVKIGRKKYLVDIKKDSASALIELYRQCGSDRKSFSKYDARADLATVFVAPDASLSRAFFDDIRKIEEAQRIVAKYRQQLSRV